MQADLAARLPLIDEDRALDKELRGLVDAIRCQAWDLYA
jgi:histidine ammonia-lyase